MLFLKPELRSLIGILFYNKLLILVLFLFWMVFSSRPFCRTACPLGAIYSLFNKHSVFRMTHDPEKCTHCKACHQNCPMGVKFYESQNDIDCIRCLKCMNESCKFGAISYEIAGFKESRGQGVKGKALGPSTLEPWTPLIHFFVTRDTEASENSTGVFFPPSSPFCFIFTPRVFTPISAGLVFIS